MTNMTTAMEQLLRNTIGYDPLVARFASIGSNYPLHNIEKLTDDHYRLTLAVAGFAQEELVVTLHKGLLTIIGEKQVDEARKKANYLYQGIAFRDFKKEFTLGANVEVSAAKVENGLLIIDLLREMPEAEKPKLIPIG